MTSTGVLMAAFVPHATSMRNKAGPGKPEPAVAVRHPLSYRSYDSL